MKLKKIIQHSIKHFGQARDSPPLHEPLAFILGDGFDQHSQLILKGEYKRTPHISPLANDFLVEMKNVPCTKLIQDQFSTTTIKTAYKKWREKTITSPSGLHLGHYKALLAPDNQKYTSQNKDNAESIWELIALTINASVKIGRGPTRFEVAHQLMAEKEIGVRFLNKLRRLNKYESEYNFILKKYMATPSNA